MEVFDFYFFRLLLPVQRTRGIRAVGEARQITVLLHGLNQRASLRAARSAVLVIAYRFPYNGPSASQAL